MNERYPFPEGVREEFSKAVQPLHDWLCKYGHPHMHIIVRQDCAEVSEGVCATRLVSPD